jgi:hypothetical protein
MLRHVMAQLVQKFVNIIIDQGKLGAETIANLQQRLTLFFQRFEMLSTARKLAVT